MKDYYKIPFKKIIKIPNPTVDLPIQKDKEAWTFGDKVVLCVGRLEPVKQQERIIRAFSIVCNKFFDARLIILGKGFRLTYLRELCKRLHIEKFVVFIGFTDNVKYYLEHARVFVMASKVEGFPNSMIEAMKYGVPIITTDAPGACAEIVGKPKNSIETRTMMLCKYGILTPNISGKKHIMNFELTEEETILSDAMLKVLIEDETYERYRRQSFKRAKMYSLDKVMKRWNDTIKDIK